MATGPALSRSLSEALAALSQGVSLANRPSVQQDSLVAALGRTPCVSALVDAGSTSASHLTVCPHNGTAWWHDTNDSAQSVMRHSEPLDSLLSEHESVWSTIVSNGRDAARLLWTRHHVSESATACGGSHYVLRVHHFCGAPKAYARIRTVSQSTQSTDASMPSWLPMRPSVESVVTAPASLRCQFESFLETPSLCALAPYGDERPRRLEHLFRRAWADGGRSGYTTRTPKGTGVGGVAHRGRSDPTTYGELSAEGVLRLLGALRRASDELDCTGSPIPHSGGAPASVGSLGLPVRSSAAEISRGRQCQLPGQARGPFDTLGVQDTFVDVGSGEGKAVAAVALLTPARSVGVEIVAERAELARHALADAAAQGLLSEAEAARVTLLHEDATRPGILPETTTYAYLSNLCFSPELNRRFMGILEALPALRCVGTLRRLPQADGEAHEGRDGGAGGARCQLHFSHALRVRMSWDDRARLYIYCCR